MTAFEYNEKVWSSQEMLKARAYLTDALAELGDESKGWGRMPLERALEQMQRAEHAIERMMRMDV